MSHLLLLNESHTHAVCNPGWHDDGGGLFLVIADDNSAQWVFRPALADGLVHAELIGDADDLHIDRARELAQACRDRLFLRRDPEGAAYRRQELSGVMLSLVDKFRTPAGRGVRHRHVVIGACP
ncbi:integrase arm-type DNA-binding domain-containing protein [Paraburkholderia rhynchosiae]|uniref:Uncharacterized protein n=1 Tax=Paraburkholderia rhynchosiae TaxID=487049 RepID=A0A2N7WHH6_9BURK|nr:integrase arm-type DNA-binding domain-containing protein [Paraburkholderia rhynchosiae]PMS28878.1 hypothetical protein C0Z16_20835 [Paraburkholderia rhynchosiae]CAB3665379.1 hypothetical protein LMG27174_01853 [Paraburkholderia rhynchosiae]